MQAFGQDFFVILSLLEVKKGQIMSLHWAVAFLTWKNATSNFTIVLGLWYISLCIELMFASLSSLWNVCLPALFLYMRVSLYKSHESSTGYCSLSNTALHLAWKAVIRHTDLPVHYLHCLYSLKCKEIVRICLRTIDRQYMIQLMLNWRQLY